MKRFLLLFFIFSICFPFVSFAEGNRSITILYTGFVTGTIAPYRLSVRCQQYGRSGPACTHDRIHPERQTIILVLDGGAVFDPKSDKAELHLKAMKRMGYDALNLGPPELHAGKEFLERTHSQFSFPYIASNLLYGGGRLPWIREYIIKEVGGIKVAILGILDPEDIKRIPSQNGLKGLWGYTSRGRP